MWVKSIFNCKPCLKNMWKMTNKQTYFFARGNRKKDLYQILGVSRDASLSDIKKAYYKLAQTHHPDKCSDLGAKDKFAEISGAYEILSNQSRRKFYDQTGSTETDPYEDFGGQDIFGAGMKGGMGGFQSIFQELFGFNNGAQHRENGPQKITINLNIEFYQAVNGAKKTIKYTKKCKCSTCKGTKSKPGTQPQKCGSCQGSGFMTIRQGMMAIRAPCTSCQGEGKKITSPCSTCKGTGIQSKQTSQQINIPKGIENDAVLKLKGKGNMNGNLEVKIQVKPSSHLNIRRSGVDVHSSEQISIYDAILGCQLQIKTIYGQTKKIKVHAGCQNDEQIKLAKQGFYNYKVNPHGNTIKGNHIVTIKVKVPTKLKDQQKQIFEKLRDLNDKTNSEKKIDKDRKTKSDQKENQNISATGDKKEAVNKAI